MSDAIEIIDVLIFLINKIIITNLSMCLKIIKNKIRLIC